MSVAKVVHAENARLSKNRVFAPYPEATHLVRLDDAEDAVRRVAAAATAAERGRTRELEAALHAARAFVNWHAEGPCGCDGEPDDQCDSCRALAVLALIEKGDTDA